MHIIPLSRIIFQLKNKYNIYIYLKKQLKFYFFKKIWVFVGGGLHVGGGCQQATPQIPNSFF
jgi:hypothetical protein